MAPALIRSIVLVGFMGAGKSTLAEAIAGELDVPWSDSDAGIEAQDGRTIAEIFEQDGEAAFREVEAGVVSRLLGGKPQVIALGGGSLGDPGVREMLEAHLVVLVDVEEEKAWERSSESGRPLAADREAFADLFRSREPQYLLAADAIVPADLADPAPLARILGEMAAEPGPFPWLLWAVAGDRSYPCWVGEGALKDAPWPATDGRRFVITDTNVGELYAGLVPGSAGLVEIPPGESAKTLETAERVWQALAEQEATRADTIVALGGGVVGDLAGFCAAGYQRGVALLQLPTTLVAQVDSAYGGKTGVDLPAAKNYVGAYHQPEAVIADTALLASLPPAEIAAGRAEVIKTGLIAGGELWARIAAGEPIDARMIRDCAWTKLKVVAADERDGGRRQVLNLGHTTGHAIEVVTGYTELRHGEAVGLGLLVALRLSGASELREEVALLLGKAGLPVDLPGLDVDAVIEATRLDKKRVGQEVPFVLCTAPGQVTPGCPVEPGLLHAAVTELAG
ncbi:MAG: bifunctional shikimate kinase/3-dehydroquinate synthase [Solirubrobacterales bacterium]